MIERELEHQRKISENLGQELDNKTQQLNQAHGKIETLELKLKSNSNSSRTSSLETTSELQLESRRSSMDETAHSTLELSNEEAAVPTEGFDTSAADNSESLRRRIEQLEAEIQKDKKRCGHFRLSTFVLTCYICILCA